MEQPNNFEWLKNEIAEVKTNKYFVIDGPATPELRKAVQQARRCQLSIATRSDVMKDFVRGQVAEAAARTVIQ